MQPIRTDNVTPKLPEALELLREMVVNFSWTWQSDARKLFRDLETAPRMIPPKSAWPFRSRI
jgi:starch phosphorylase